MQTSQIDNKKWARRFFTIWTGQAFSLFGSSLVQFALIWWLTKESGSATVLAVAALVGMLPQIVIGPFAGALVDRLNRRVILIVADSAIAVSTLLLAYLFKTDQVQVWHVFAIMAFRSIGAAFHFPAMSASTPLMVPKEQLTRVQGLNQTLQGVNGLVAPPAGAVLIALFPTFAVLLIDVGTAMLAVLPLFFFMIPQPERHASSEQAQKPGLWQDIREAVKYIRAWPGLVAILLMALFLNFMLVPTGALLPLLVTKHFNRGALDLGFLNSAEGIGIIAGGILLSTWGGFKRKIATSLTGIITLGIAVAMLGFAPQHFFYLAVAGTFLTGAALPITNGPIGALLQSVIRNEMQGRVMSLVGSAATAISPLGLLIAGPLSDVLGIRTWYLAGGLICIIVGLAGFFIPAIMDIEKNREEGVPSAVIS